MCKNASTMATSSNTTSQIDTSQFCQRCFNKHKIRNLKPFDQSAITWQATAIAQNTFIIKITVIQNNWMVTRRWAVTIWQDKNPIPLDYAKAVKLTKKSSPNNKPIIVQMDTTKCNSLSWPQNKHYDYKIERNKKDVDTSNDDLGARYPTTTTQKDK